MLGRLGGDEVAWLLHGSPDDVLTAAQRTVATFGTTYVPDVGTTSISAGVAVTAASIEPEALFELADASLYRAKADGRGTAVLAGLRHEHVRAAPHDHAASSRAPAMHEAVGSADVLAVGEAVVRDWLDTFRAAGCSLSLLVDNGTALRSVVEIWGGALASLDLGATYPLADYPITARALEERRPDVLHRRPGRRPERGGDPPSPERGRRAARGARPGRARGGADRALRTAVRAASRPTSAASP